MRHFRPAAERGHANHGWLDSYHSFSFADYYDPRYMGFSALRVINDDRIAAGAGFPTHPHQEMEILTYVLSGAVAHKDSMGNIATVAAGEFQIMSAGTGITHSEYNPLPEQELHLYQIWIMPSTAKVTPRYAQQRFDAPQGRQLILSPDAADGSLKVYQDMRLWRWAFRPQETGSVLPIAAGRRLWLQGVRGQVRVDGQLLAAGDGLAVWDEAQISLEPLAEDAEVLLFDLP
jgi:quercetin 2,3-dioxygenase